MKKRGPKPQPFWDRVDKTDSCWLWAGPKFWTGYGQVAVDGYPHLTHRRAWEMTHGPIPDGLCVCHHCDVRACVRPEHLFLGTHAENNLDMRTKGRSRTVRGEEHPNTRLTEADVVGILNLAREGSMTQRAIAHQYGLSYMAVSNIVNRRRWAHVVWPNDTTTHTNMGSKEAA